MVGSINSLMNTEMALYGGYGLGSYSNCPSILNGYCASSSAYQALSPSFKAMQQYATDVYDKGRQVADKGLSSYSDFTQTASERMKQAQADFNNSVNEVADYVSKKNIVEEDFAGALKGGITFAVMENMLSVFHPVNSFKAMKDTDKVFKQLMEASPKLKELWKTEPHLMQRAYNQLYTANRNSKSKWFYSKWFQNPISETELKDLEKRMVDALKTNNVDAIRKASEELQAARGMNGRIPRAFDWIRNLFRSEDNQILQKTCQDRIAEKSIADAKTGKSVIESSIQEQKEIADMFKSGTAGRVSTFAKRALSEGKGWFLFDMAFSLPKIFTAFKNGGTDAGFTQTAQSAVKAAGNAVGWVAGRAIGSAIGTKVGATIGSAICPGIGTAAGAVIGFIGGCVGQWAVNTFITNKLIPENEEVANKLELAQKKSTPEGQAQLLQELGELAQNGEQIPPSVINSANTVANNLQKYS